MSNNARTQSYTPVRIHAGMGHDEPYRFHSARLLSSHLLCQHTWSVCGSAPRTRCARRVRACGQAASSRRSTRKEPMISGVRDDATKTRQRDPARIDGVRRRSGSGVDARASVATSAVATRSPSSSTRRTLEFALSETIKDCPSTITRSAAASARRHRARRVASNAVHVDDRSERRRLSRSTRCRST